MAGRAIEARPTPAPGQGVVSNLPFRSSLSSLTGQYIMAITGLVLILFILAHMVGNLLIFGGQDALNSYAHSLEEHPGLLWLARALLLIVFNVHIAVGTHLTVQSRAARPIRYVCWKPLQSSWAARHMLLTGLLVLAFVVYHLSHFTFGVTDPRNFKYALPTDPRGHPDVAGMVVGGFSQTPVAVCYVAAQVVLGLYLAHGARSWFQHLGLNRENHLKPWSWSPLSGSGRRGNARLVHGFGVAVTATVVLGNCSVPLAIQLGWRPTGLIGQLPTTHRPRERSTLP